MSENSTRGLPADLAVALRDQSIIVPQDAGVFSLIAEWTNAPGVTASAELPDRTREALFTSTESATTPAAC